MAHQYGYVYSPLRERRQARLAMVMDILIAVALGAIGGVTLFYGLAS